MSLVRAAWERRPEGPAYLLSICDAPISRRPVCFLLHTLTPLDQWNSEGFSRVPTIPDLTPLTVFSSERDPTVQEVRPLKLEKVFFSKCLKQSPGWAEITYVNSLSGSQLFEERDFFLSWTFATVLNQHGHALDVALRADDGLRADRLVDRRRALPLDRRLRRLRRHARSSPPRQRALLHPLVHRLLRLVVVDRRRRGRSTRGRRRR